MEHVERLGLLPGWENANLDDLLSSMKRLRVVIFGTYRRHLPFEKWPNLVEIEFNQADADSVRMFLHQKRIESVQDVYINLLGSCMSTDLLLFFHLFPKLRILSIYGGGEEAVKALSFYLLSGPVPLEALSLHPVEAVNLDILTPALRLASTGLKHVAFRFSVSQDETSMYRLFLHLPQTIKSLVLFRCKCSRAVGWWLDKDKRSLEVRKFVTDGQTENEDNHIVIALQVLRLLEIVVNEDPTEDAIVLGKGLLEAMPIIFEISCESNAFRDAFLPYSQRLDLRIDHMSSTSAAISRTPTSW